MAPHLELVQTIESPQPATVWKVAWNPSGSVLASCGTDKKIRLWAEEAPGKFVCKTILTDGHQRTIRSVEWSPCGRRLASCSFDGTACVWEKREDFECVATLEGHESEVKSVSWAKSGDTLATCSRDKSVWVWGLEVDEEEDGDDLQFECLGVLSSHTQDVKHVAWHPHLPLLCSASYDDTVRLFSEDPLDEWSCCKVLEGHESTVWCARFNPAGNMIASCSDDKAVRLWKCSAGSVSALADVQAAPWNCVCTLASEHTRSVFDLDWSSEGYLATACGDNGIRIIAVDTCGAHGGNSETPVLYMVTKEEAAHGQDVNCVSWNPSDPGLLASCSDDGAIKIWRFHPD